MAQPGTNRQIANDSILDHFGRQAYLCNRWNYILAVTAAGTSEVAQILIANPAVTVSAFPASYVSLFVDLRSLVGVTASSNNIVRSYLNPTVSAAGSAAVAINSRTGATNSGVAVITSGPTISANGTLVEILAAGAYTYVSSNGLFILDPGNSLLITVQSATSAVTNVAVGYYEL